MFQGANGTALIANHSTNKNCESCNCVYCITCKLHMLFSVESGVLYMCMGKRNNRCASIAESCTDCKNTINESFVVSGCLLIKHVDWNNTFKKLKFLFHQHVS